MKIDKDCNIKQIEEGGINYNELSDIEIQEVINCHFNSLLRSCKRCQAEESRRLIEKAFRFANSAHKGVKRKSGEPYIIHPIEVAKIAASEIGLGTKAICAALMHDVVEDTNYTIEDIENLFGEKIAYLVGGLTKIESVKKKSGQNPDNFSIQAENFRSLIFTISKDIRVVFLKIADRLHNMRTLEHMPRASQLRSAAETLEIYAPLAHRLGMYNIKSELEDLAFRYRDKDKYLKIRNKIEHKYKTQQQILNGHAVRIGDILMKEKVITGNNFDITSRQKTIYSIAQKMEKQNVDFDQVFDKMALRIVFEPDMSANIYQQCWNILGLVNLLYKPIPGRLRDWIKTPKPNGYQALHTTVMTDTGNRLEIQIRTEEMNQIAEKGFASHWEYKGNKNFLRELDNLIEQVNDEILNPNSNPIDFLDKFKIDLETPEITVFTPKGKIIKLTNGATPLDFAFKIHTDIGLYAIAAKVDKKLVSLFTTLKNGDQVEILTSKRNKPKREWLKFVKSHKAISVLSSYYRKEDKKIAKKGKEKYLQKLTELNAIKRKSEVTQRLLSFFDKNTTDELYIAIENRVIKLYDLRSAIKKALSLEKLKGSQEQFKDKIQSIKVEKLKKGRVSELNPRKVHRVGDNLDLTKYEIAECCKPLPGEEVLGYKQVDKDKLIIHRTTCQKANSLNSKHKALIVPLKWTATKDFLSHANIIIEGVDRKGIVLKVLQVISDQMNVNMSKIEIKSELGVFKGEIGLYVKDLTKLNNILNRIIAIYGVTAVYRKSSRI